MSKGYSIINLTPAALPPDLQFCEAVVSLLSPLFTATVRPNATYVSAGR